MSLMSALCLTYKVNKLLEISLVSIRNHRYTIWLPIKTTKIILKPTTIQALTVKSSNAMVLLFTWLRSSKDQSPKWFQMVSWPWVKCQKSSSNSSRTALTHRLRIQKSLDNFCYNRKQNKTKTLWEGWDRVSLYILSWPATLCRPG